MAKSTRFRTGIVLDNHDPESAGRVLVQVGPTGRARAQEPLWARLTAPSAGVWFPPEIGDEVLVAFEGGTADQAYVIGALWGVPGSAPDPEVKALRSRSGLAITLDETAGDGSIRITTAGGRALTLQDGPDAVTVADSHGNALRLEASGVTITAAARVRIESNVIELSAGLVNVNAGAAHVSGIVQCDTLIANSVISTTYTPGQGNLY